MAANASSSLIPDRTPARVRGSLVRHSRKKNLMGGVAWRLLREVELNQGRLTSFQRIVTPYVKSIAFTFKGAIDFAHTSCEVELVHGSDTKFLLRPKHGHVWSTLDHHKFGGTAHEYVFDAKGSHIPRSSWVEALWEHIAYGQARATQDYSRYVANIDAAFVPSAAPPMEATCNICLAELCGSGEVATTRCGHTFHAECVRKWLEKRRTCPLCRHELL